MSVYNKSDIDYQKLISLLKNGGVFCYPTETLYGLGCLANNEEAIEKIYKIKQREKEEVKVKLIKYYTEDDLFQIYKRFQFNIDQLLNAKAVFKSLTKIESRALLYQTLLLESDINKKVELMKLLKESFIKDKIGNAFEDKLKDLLKEIELDQISSEHTSFYLENINTDGKKQSKIRYNDDLLHQSKLIKYFDGDYNQTKIVYLANSNIHLNAPTS